MTPSYLEQVQIRAAIIEVLRESSASGVGRQLLWNEITKYASQKLRHADLDEVLQNAIAAGEIATAGPRFRLTEKGDRAIPHKPRLTVAELRVQILKHLTHDYTSKANVLAKIREHNPDKTVIATDFREAYVQESNDNRIEAFPRSLRLKVTE